MQTFSDSVDSKQYKPYKPNTWAEEFKVHHRNISGKCELNAAIWDISLIYTLLDNADFKLS